MKNLNIPIFFIIMLCLIVLSYFFIDKEVARYFLAHKALYEPIGDTISILGESHWYIASGIIGYFFYKNKNTIYANRFLFLLYSNLFSGLISLVLKNLFGRIRPWGLRDGGDEFGFLLFQNFDMGLIEKFRYHFTTILDAPTTYTSFPSGHTTTVFAFFAYLALLFPRYIPFYFGGAVIVASSRILANDHFISDLLAGVIIGTLSTKFLYDKMKEKI